MACDCDCQMLKTIKYLIKKNKELEERVRLLENPWTEVLDRDVYANGGGCECKSSK